jgi:5-methylcytosine-specific restriction endonuclease McrA
MKRRPNCNCAVCDNPMYRRPIHIASGKVYCSLKCCGIGQRVPRSCSVCKQMYFGLKRTCSRKCANISRKGISYTGENTMNKACIGTALKVELAEARGGACERCGETNYAILQIHHKRERARGGSNIPSNLLLLCPNCHAAHHLGFCLFEKKKGGKVRQHKL